MAKIVTITNPLTGQPAQVDQLDHTAQQIDDGLNIARGVSNPNLLDNSVFLPGCLVDQRQGYVVPLGTEVFSDSAMTTSVGKTSQYYNVIEKTSTYVKIWTGAANRYAPASTAVRGYATLNSEAIYTIDRWIVQSGYVLVNDGYITWGNAKSTGACQYKETIPVSVLPGKQLVFSIMTTTGVYTNTIVAPAVDEYSVKGVTVDGVVLDVRVYCNSDGTATFVLRKDSTIFSLNLVGIKFELGTTQTLAHQDSSGKWVLNEIPDYGEQLARCMAYAVQLDKNGGIGIVQNETTAYVTFPLSVPLKLRSGVHPVINQNYPAYAWTSKGTTTITNAVLNDNYNGKQVLSITLIGDFSGVQSGSVINSYLFAPFISNDL